MNGGVTHGCAYWLVCVVNGSGAMAVSGVLLPVLFMVLFHIADLGWLSKWYYYMYKWISKMNTSENTYQPLSPLTDTLPHVTTDLM